MPRLKSAVNSFILTKKKFLKKKGKSKKIRMRGGANSFTRFFRPKPKVEITIEQAQELIDKSTTLLSKYDKYEEKIKDLNDNDINQKIFSLKNNKDELQELVTQKKLQQIQSKYAEVNKNYIILQEKLETIITKSEKLIDDSKKLIDDSKKLIEIYNSKIGDNINLPVFQNEKALKIELEISIENMEKKKNEFSSQSNNAAREAMNKGDDNDIVKSVKKDFDDLNAKYIKLQKIYQERISESKENQKPVVNKMKSMNSKSKNVYVNPNSRLLKRFTKKKKEREKGNGNNTEGIETFFGKIEKIIKDVTEKLKTNIKDENSYTLLKKSIDDSIFQSIETINEYLKKPQLSDNKLKLEKYLEELKKKKGESEELYSKIGKKIEEDSKLSSSNSLLTASSEIPVKIGIVNGQSIDTYECKEEIVQGGSNKTKRNFLKKKDKSKKNRMRGGMFSKKIETPLSFKENPLTLKEEVEKSKKIVEDAKKESNRIIKKDLTLSTEIKDKYIAIETELLKSKPTGPLNTNGDKLNVNTLKFLSDNLNGILIKSKEKYPIEKNTPHKDLENSSSSSELDGPPTEVSIVKDGITKKYECIKTKTSPYTLTGGSKKKKTKNKKSQKGGRRRR